MRARRSVRPSWRRQTTARVASRSRSSRPRAWQFLPYIPAGQFDVVNAYRPNISGVLNSYVLAYWNIEKR